MALPKEIANLPPVERIKALKALEVEKKKELEEKEKEHKQALEEAEDLIKKSIEDLTEEAAHNYKEYSEALEQKKSQSLEETVAEEQAQPVSGHVSYGSPLEGLQERPEIYDLVKKDVVYEVERLERKSHAEGLSNHEQDLLDQVRYEVTRATGGESKFKDDTYSNLVRLKTALSEVRDHQKDLYNR